MLTAAHTDGQLIQHEDVQLSMAGLTFSSLLASCFPVAPSRFRILSLGEPPEERTVSIDDVFAAMSDANEWIESNVEDSEIKSALLKRLELRTVRHISCTHSFLC